MSTSEADVDSSSDSKHKAHGSTHYIWITTAYVLGLVVLSCGLAYVRPTPPAPGLGVAVRLHDAFGMICTGVSLGPGLVLTAAHCGGANLRVENRPVVETRRPWSGLDAEVLYVPGLDVQAAQWAPKHPKIGSYGTITGWGCSLGLKATVYRMRLEERDEEGGYYAGLVCHADSGAPVYDELGRLVGVVRSLANRKYTAVTWLTPIDTLSLALQHTPGAKRAEPTARTTSVRPTSMRRPSSLQTREVGQVQVAEVDGVWFYGGCSRLIRPRVPAQNSLIKISAAR